MVQKYNSYINESNTECDKLTIKASFTIDFYDFDYKYLVISALQKQFYYDGLDSVSVTDYMLENSEIKLKVVNYKHLKDNDIEYTFDVKYNCFRHNFNMDSESSILNTLTKIFKNITYYQYKTEQDSELKRTVIEYKKINVID